MRIDVQSVYASCITFATQCSFQGCFSFYFSDRMGDLFFFLYNVIPLIHVPFQAHSYGESRRGIPIRERNGRGGVTETHV